MTTDTTPSALTPPATSHRSVVRQSLFVNFLILCAILALQLTVIWDGTSSIGVDSLWLPQTVVLTDATGMEIRRLYLEKDRLELADDAFSPFLKQAVVAIEDERFLTRGSCIDPRSILRALVADLTKYKSQGASTITQQLVGNLLLDRSDKSYARKFVETLLACRLEQVASPDRILGLYLNHMPFGGTLYGAEEASQTYFGVGAQHLTLAQSVVLAALLKAPTYYSPYTVHLHATVRPDIASAIRKGILRRTADIPDNGIISGLIGTRYAGQKGGTVYIEGRTDFVLQAMQRSGYIDDAQAEEAGQELRTMRFERRESVISMPYFALLVQKQLNRGAVRADRVCDARAGGCIIRTTINPEFQALAERIVLEHAEKIRTKYAAKNIALVAADRATGHILAYVGNVRFGDSETGSMIDMAQVPRQPGSSFKPFVYATAFAAGMNPGTFLLDAPLTLGSDRPRNYEGGYRGWTSISHALAASRNIPAIRALLMVGGEDPVLETAERVGITTPTAMRGKMRLTDPQFSFGYPLAIGSAEIPLIEMVQGYSTIANAGLFRPLSTIERIQTVDGRPLDTNLNDVGMQAMDPLYARWLTSILSDTSIRPTPGWNAALTIPGIQTAIKTGTSDRCVGIDPGTNLCNDQLPGDVWTMGYTPEFVLGIWVGNADYAPLTWDADGMNVVAPMWKEFMQEAHQLRPEGLTRFPPELIARKWERK